MVGWESSKFVFKKSLTLVEIAIHTKEYVSVIYRQEKIRDPQEDYAPDQYWQTG